MNNASVRYSEIADILNKHSFTTHYVFPFLILSSFSVFFFYDMVSKFFAIFLHLCNASIVCLSAQESNLINNIVTSQEHNIITVLWLTRMVYYG